MFVKVAVPDNCGNSPRAKLAIKPAIAFVGDDFATLEPYLAPDFTWETAGTSEVLDVEATKK